MGSQREAQGPREPGLPPVTCFPEPTVVNKFHKTIKQITLPRGKTGGKQSNQVTHKAAIDTENRDTRLTAGKGGVVFGRVYSFGNRNTYTSSQTRGPACPSGGAPKTPQIPAPVLSATAFALVLLPL